MVGIALVSGGVLGTHAFHRQCWGQLDTDADLGRRNEGFVHGSSRPAGGNSIALLLAKRQAQVLFGRRRWIAGNPGGSGGCVGGGSGVDLCRAILLLWADTANHHVISVQRPEWHVRFDMDKDAAAATRKRVFDMAARERLPVTGYHMPFPAFGYVETRDEGYHYVPHSYQLLM